MSKKSLLIIGPGFLGREIVRLASDSESNFSVYAASRSGSIGVGGMEYADLSHLDSLLALQQKLQPDYVIHCAASGRSTDRLASYKSVYLEGSKNLVKAFPKARKLFTSSTSVYAQTDGSTVTETSETIPDSDTAKILLEAERVILDNGGTVARLSGIYGNGRAYMLKRLFEGEAVIEGEGTRLLNHIHHIDAAKACLFLLDQAPGIYNVSDSTCLSQRETYRRLSRSFELPMPQTIDASSATTSKRGFSDKSVSNKKLLHLGWLPQYPCFAEAAKSLNLDIQTADTQVK